MVSVGTQTPWSWLSDHRPAFTGAKENSPGIDEPKAVVAPAKHSIVLPPLPAATAIPGIDHQPAHNLSVVSSPRTGGAGDGRGETRNAAASLPQIGSCRGKTSLQSEPSELANHEVEPLYLSGGKEGVTLPALVGQLSELEFPSGISSSDDSTSDEEEDGSTEDNSAPLSLKEKQSPYPDLGVGQLPWPAVLQYLRESESEASMYFSLDQAVEHRELDLQPVEDVTELSDSQRTVAVASFSTSDRGDMTAGPVVERMDRECDFCGQKAAQWSVLHATTGAGLSQTEACCCQFKEYCVLVAACLRQMIAERTSEQPAKISVRLKKDNMKKTAEEKALALMRRRKMWEEQQRRRKMKKTLQSSSFYSLTKQTKTIQFSLASPAVLNTGWMVGERERRRKGGRGTREKSKGRRKKGDTQPGKLPADILELLKSTKLSPRALDVRKYRNSTQLFSILLPDNTGQYFYPSGSLAVLIYSPNPGMLSYLLFNDTGSGGGAGELLCYVDELGKAFCYHPSSLSLRLQLSVCGEGVIYSLKGGEVRRWRWERGDVEQTRLTPFQPLSLALNKQLSIQCSRKDELVVSFSVSQHHVKFNIPRKLKESSRSAAASEDHLPQNDTYQQYLTYMQSKLEYMLAAFSSDGGRSRHLPELQCGHRSGRLTSRPRSRSTGALSLSTTTYPLSSSRKLV